MLLVPPAGSSCGGTLLDGLVVLFVHLGRLAIAMNLLEILVVDFDLIDCCCVAVLRR